MEDTTCIREKISKKSKDSNFCDEMKTSGIVHKVIKESLKKKRSFLDKKYSKKTKHWNKPEVRKIFFHRNY